MRRRCLLSCVSLFVAAQFLPAAVPRVAVSDFAVSSERPRLEVVGKGLAEMIAAEMARAGDIVLIDRDRRIKLLGDQDFVLSVAGRDQKRIGELLAADYVLSGEIVDLDLPLAVVASMVEVASGQVVWKDKYLGALADYDLISTQFAHSALDYLGASKGEATPAAPLKATPAEKEEALFAFSAAVDFFDRGDKEEARNQLEIARRIDPKNPAVELYLNKVAAATRRRQVDRRKQAPSHVPELDLEQYGPSYNPALLGLIESGSFYYWVCGTPPWDYDNVAKTVEDKVNWDFLGLKFSELIATQRLGALVPLGKRFGLATEVSWRTVDSQVARDSVPQLASNFPGLSQISLYSQTLGAQVGVGYDVGENVGVGIGARIAVIGPAEWLWCGEAPPDNAYTLLDATGVSYAIDAGLTAELGALGTEAQVIWSNQPDPYIDDVADPVNRTLNAGTVPLILVVSVRWKVPGGRLVATVKEIVDVYTDERSTTAFTLIPALEWRPLDGLALRAGYEYSMAVVDEISRGGHGFRLGLSQLLGRWEIHLDGGFRLRPNRVFLPYLWGEPIMQLGLVWNGLLRQE
jgi:TolB-like protein/opacity protein-like surface antigen